MERMIIRPDVTWSEKAHENCKRLGYKINKYFSLCREPDNPEDPNAIRVHLDENLMGYVPKKESKILAPRMDVGEEFEAKFISRNENKQFSIVSLTVEIIPAIYPIREYLRMDYQESLHRTGDQEKNRATVLVTIDKEKNIKDIVAYNLEATWNLTGQPKGVILEWAEQGIINYKTYKGNMYFVPDEIIEKFRPLIDIDDDSTFQMGQFQKFEVTDELPYQNSSECPHCGFLDKELEAIEYYIATHSSGPCPVVDWFINCENCKKYWVSWVR